MLLGWLVVVVAVAVMFCLYDVVESTCVLCWLGLVCLGYAALFLLLLLCFVLLCVFSDVLCCYMFWFG